MQMQIYLVNTHTVVVDGERYMYEIITHFGFER